MQNIHIVNRCGSEVFLEGSPAVFVGQHNVSQLIYGKLLDLGLINSTFKDINLLVCTPAKVSLVEQTRLDLQNFCESNLVLGSNKHVIRKKVLESVSSTKNLIKDVIVKNNKKEVLSRSKEYHDFVKLLDQDKSGEYLHLLIRDECHWGIKENSMTIKFFNQIDSVLARPGPKPKFLLVLVSATCDVLTYTVDGFSESAHIVDWDKLLEDTDKDNGPYAAPLYVSVDELDHQYDSRDDFMKLTLKERGRQLCCEYLFALQRKLQGDDDRSIIEASTAPGNTFREPVRHLPVKTQRKATAENSRINEEFEEHDSHDEEVEEKEEEENETDIETIPIGVGQTTLDIISALFIPRIDQKPKMVVIRLREKAVADVMVAGMVALCKNNLDYHVIGLYGDRKIEDQLPDEIQDQILNRRKYNDGSPLAVTELNWLNVILILLDKINIGDRLPPTCTHFDVRARYRCDKDGLNLLSGQATFVQDVGRCAGHKRDDYSSGFPQIFLALQDPQTSPSFKILDSNLDGSNSPTKFHPECDGNSNIFSKLLQYSVLLKAKPQIGKTGTFLDLIKTIYDQHIVQPIMSPTPTKRLQDEVLTFGRLCHKLRSLANGPNGIRGVEEYLKEVYNGKSNFELYHTMLNDNRTRRNSDTNEAIVNQRLEDLMVLKCDNDSAPKEPIYSIADCGCGMHGIFPKLLQKLNTISFLRTIKWLKVDIIVHGFDLSPHINNIVSDKFSFLKFVPHVQDMGSDCREGTSASEYDCIVYNCSLWENDCTKHIQWANRNLKVGGHLIICTFKRLLPTDWKLRFTQFGFNIVNEINEAASPYWEYSGVNPYFMFSVEKGSVYSPDATMIMNSYGDIDECNLTDEGCA